MNFVVISLLYVLSVCCNQYKNIRIKQEQVCLNFKNVIDIYNNSLNKIKIEKYLNELDEVMLNNFNKNNAFEKIYINHIYEFLFGLNKKKIVFKFKDPNFRNGYLFKHSENFFDINFFEDADVALILIPEKYFKVKEICYCYPLSSTIEDFIHEEKDIFDSLYLNRNYTIINKRLYSAEKQNRFNIIECKINNAYNNEDYFFSYNLPLIDNSKMLPIALISENDEILQNCRIPSFKKKSWGPNIFVSSSNSNMLLYSTQTNIRFNHMPDWQLKYIYYSILNTGSQKFDVNIVLTIIKDLKLSLENPLSRVFYEDLRFKEKLKYNLRYLYTIFMYKILFYKNILIITLVLLLSFSLIKIYNWGEKS